MFNQVTIGYAARKAFAHLFRSILAFIAFCIPFYLWSCAADLFVDHWKWTGGWLMLAGVPTYKFVCWVGNCAFDLIPKED